MEVKYTFRMYERDRGLVDTVRDRAVSVDKTFEDLGIKETLLRSYGYKNLKGGGKIEECEDVQLGVAFRNIFFSALENITRYEQRIKENREEYERKKASEPGQEDLFPEMFGYSHSDDGSLEYRKQN